MSELKPCPFCGSAYIERGSFPVRCTTCNGQGPIPLPGSIESHWQLWNTRANPEADLLRRVCGWLRRNDKFILDKEFSAWNEVEGLREWWDEHREGECD